MAKEAPCFKLIEEYPRFRIGSLAVPLGRVATVNTLFGSRTSLQTALTVIGRDSGARVSIPVTITKTN